VDDPAYIDPVTKELVKLSIFPRARQQPLPPIWQVVNSLDSIRQAAGQDMGIIMWRPGIGSLQQRLRVYREAVKEATGADLPVGARTAIQRDTFVASSEDEAVRIAGGPLMDSLNFSNWRGPSIYLEPGETLAVEQEAALKQHLPYEFVRERCVWFGTPERIIGKIEQLHRETGIEGVIFKSSWAGLPYADCYRSVRRIGEEVLPALTHLGQKRAEAAD
jgi:alkanesulfonate monooxygenase SsuD/methylene tetrahydromethanopterin reductase-like flavin-dependent oxidoreductase (luciferase family)